MSTVLNHTSSAITVNVEIYCMLDKACSISIYTEPTTQIFNTNFVYLILCVQYSVLVWTITNILLCSNTL